MITFLIEAIYFSFVRERNWILIQSVIGHDNYFKIVSKLQGNGVKYMTKISPDLSDGQVGNQFPQYDIYVKRDDEHKAYQAINIR